MSAPKPSAMGMMDEPLETPEAARRLGVSRHTLFKWRTQGRGPIFSKRGGKIVYLVSDLKAYEMATRVTQASDNVLTILPIDHMICLLSAIVEWERKQGNRVCDPKYNSDEDAWSYRVVRLTAAEGQLQ